MNKKFEVELWINTVGETPEHKVTKNVIAVDKDDALNKAREKVKLENTDLNHMKIDTWFIKRTYS
jgi:hypothetical protein